MATVSLPIRQFKIIYQVFKEIPNIGGVEVPAGLSQEALDQAHVVMDCARRATKESATTRLVFIFDDRESGRSSPMAERDDETVIVHIGGVATRLSSWPSIVHFITDTLGEPETYFRTGYSAGEIRSTVASLAEELQGIHE